VTAEPAPSPISDDRAALWRRLGWIPSSEQLSCFAHLQELLRSWNGRVNLTRLVEGDDFWVGQVFDSLRPLRSFLHDPPRHCIDVGTGCGFPGLAVAIAMPATRVTLVDSVGRKVEAVRSMAGSLGLASRVTLRCERIEQTGRDADCRGRFDLAVARAVAAAPVVAEYLLPLLTPEGTAVLYRGHWTAQDRQGLERALGALRGSVTAVERLELPAGRGIRHAVRLARRGRCPDTYPRAVGTPARLPLG
jgi:16S rRNA (guanine527-N7)-methyltransferase